MKVVKVRNNQNLLDLAVQELGSVERVFELATANRVSITATLPINSEITVNGSPGRIARIFNENKWYPASAQDNDLAGINYQPIPTIIFGI